MATSKKVPETSTRRIWRMSADMPLGEYVDVAPVTPEHESRIETPRRRATDMSASTTPASEDSGLRRRSGDMLSPVPAQPKLLKPAQVESWQASSFDLLSGCRTRDVTDTIPDNVFDELFGPADVEAQSRPPASRKE